MEGEEDHGDVSGDLPAASHTKKKDTMPSCADEGFRGSIPLGTELVGGWDPTKLPMRSTDAVNALGDIPAGIDILPIPMETNLMASAGCW